MPGRIPAMSGLRSSPAHHRSEYTHEISELRLLVHFELRVSVAGVFQPEFHGEISAARDCCDTDTGLRCDARVSALHSFYFFQRIERLELEARRLAAMAAEGPGASATRRQIVNEVAGLRQAGEIKSYIDLLFLALIVLLCISKIVTN
jgi:hypothetical protein